MFRHSCVFVPGCPAHRPWGVMLLPAGHSTVVGASPVVCVSGPLRAASCAGPPQPMALRVCPCEPLVSLSSCTLTVQRTWGGHGEDKVRDPRACGGVGAQGSFGPARQAMPVQVNPVPTSARSTRSCSGDHSWCSRVFLLCHVEVSRTSTPHGSQQMEAGPDCG